MDVLPGSEPEREPAPSRSLVVAGPRVDDLKGAATTAGTFLVLYVGICTGLVALVASAATTNPWDWLRGGVLAAGAGLHGRVLMTYKDSPPISSSVTDSSSDPNSFGTSFTTSISSSIGLTVLTATIIAVLVALRLGRRAERSAPSSSTRATVGAGVLTGVLAAAGLAVIGAFSSFSEKDLGGNADGSNGNVHLAIVSTLLWGSAALAAVFTWARVQEHRRQAGLPSLRAEVSRRTRGLSPWIATAAQHAVLSAVFLVIAGFVYGLATSDHEVHQSTGQATSSDVAGFLALVLSLPNLALGLTGFFMGFSLDIGGFLGGFGGGGSIGLITGDLPAKGYLWVLAPLAAAVVVGARRAALRPSPSLVAGWWQAGLGSLVVWVPLALLLRIDVGASTGFGGAGYSTGYTVATLLPFAFGWGVLVMLLGRVAAGPVTAVLPRLARGAVVEQEGPAPARLSRRTTVVLLAVGTVLVAAVGGYAVVNHTLFNPRDTAQHYLDALAAGDVKAALAQVDASNTTSPLLVPGALPPDKRIQHPRITDVSVHGSSAQVSFSYQLDGSSEDDTLTMTRTGSKALVFHDWKVSGQLDKLTVELPSDVGDVTVNGVRVSSGLSDGVPALPGLYDVELADSGYLTVSDNPHQVGFGNAFGFDFGSDGPTSLELTPEAEDKATQAVDAEVTACFAAATTPDTTCGAGMFAVAPRYDNVHWTLVTPPELSLHYSDGEISVSTDTIGVAHITATAVGDAVLGGKARQPVDKTYDVQVDGTVTFSGGTATFHPS